MILACWVRGGKSIVRIDSICKVHGEWKMFWIRRDAEGVKDLLRFGWMKCKHG